MRRKLITVVLAVAVIVSLVIGGCAKPAPVPPPTPAPPPAPAPAPAWEWPMSLKITTQAIESGGYVNTQGWAPILEEQTGTKVRLTPEEIGPLRFKPVREGEYQLATQNVYDAKFLLEAVRGFATRDGGPFQVRVVWPASIEYFSVPVRGDSEIKTIHDLKPEVRFGVWPGPAPLMGAHAVAAWAGLKPEEIEIVEFGSMPAGVRAVPEGKVDCVTCSVTGSIAIEIETTPHGIRWISLDPKEDPEGAARYLEIQPLMTFCLAPERAVKSAQGVSVFRMTVAYMTREDADAQLMYHLAKWLDENFDAYKDKSTGCPDLKIDVYRDILDTIAFPVHDGVVKYLKEKGMWTAEDDKKQAYNADLVTKYCETYKAAIAEADKRGITVDPKNEAWMNLWAEYKKNIPVFKTMYEIP